MNHPTLSSDDMLLYIFKALQKVAAKIYWFFKPHLIVYANIAIQNKYIDAFNNTQLRVS